MSGQIDKEQAIRIAKLAAEQAGHPWIEPTHVSDQGDNYVVSDNAEMLGGAVVVTISRETGKVDSFRFYAR